MAEANRTLPKVSAPGAHFVIVEGRFYDDLNDMLVTGARRAIEAAGATCEVVTLPGALEIPVAVEMIRAQAESGQRRADGFVAIGVVIRGETTHYEIVSNESARALLSLATGRRIALGNGILTVENYAQAESRANPDKMDKGGDAARAAMFLYALQRSELEAIR
ncbi:MAG: 6,7-dimethyl-8-ribityllumazine synthase [Proteobacteria bacterium]|nr:6,7-dimethyl-8-ribityllumazine synthase [Pseudomonadota bacterium]